MMSLVYALIIFFNPTSVSDEDRKMFLKKYLENINFHENKDIWFDKVKNNTEQMGYATNIKIIKDIQTVTKEV